MDPAFFPLAFSCFTFKAEQIPQLYLKGSAISHVWVVQLRTGVWNRAN